MTACAILICRGGRLAGICLLIQCSFCVCDVIILCLIHRESCIIRELTAPIIEDRIAYRHLWLHYCNNGHGACDACSLAACCRCVGIGRYYIVIIGAGFIRGRLICRIYSTINSHSVKVVCIGAFVPLVRNCSFIGCGRLTIQGCGRIALLIRSIHQTDCCWCSRVHLLSFKEGPVTSKLYDRTFNGCGPTTESPFSLLAVFIRS